MLSRVIMWQDTLRQARRSTTSVQPPGQPVEAETPPKAGVALAELIGSLVLLLTGKVDIQLFSQSTM